MAEQQKLRTKEIAPEDELRIEQTKLHRLQEELERLDKALEISETVPRGERLEDRSKGAPLSAREAGGTSARSRAER